ncbi:hypothetical protein [Lentzea guizhouensis]|uniref:hypothetical protein n=1 Tax=Lentzea guizhouensis TaxID=1586287 RepID=UPI0012B6A4EC|nr:hypothetical protein [Lentzea guizhouensis]
MSHENGWRLLREGPVSWSGIWKVLVLVAGLALFVVAVLAVLWALGFRFELGPVVVGPVPTGAELPATDQPFPFAVRTGFQDNPFGGALI